MSLPKHLQRVRNFTMALVKHAKNGAPKASQEVIDERLAICELCPHFQGQHCNKCGCACKGNRVFLNKLAWADQECPIGKWKAVEPS
tara:strand:- start:410 stop:670 length:261 start_codon:yes stop_codon:yes gene_type:complete